MTRLNSPIRTAGLVRKPACGRVRVYKRNELSQSTNTSLHQRLCSPEVLPIIRMNSVPLALLTCKAVRGNIALRAEREPRQRKSGIRNIRHLRCQTTRAMLVRAWDPCGRLKRIEYWTTCPRTLWSKCIRRKNSCGLGDETRYDANRHILARMLDSEAHSPDSLRVGICERDHGAACKTCKNLKAVAISESHNSDYPDV